MTTQTQEHSQSLVVVSDNQFPPSYVQDSQPINQMAPDSEVFELSPKTMCFFLGSPKDAKFLNTPIQNYDQMQHIFSFGLATDNHAMGFGEPLGTPMPDGPDSQTKELETIILDGPEKVFEHVSVLDRKRKRGGLMEEEISVFTSMTEAIKEVATAIREIKTINVHPDMYTAVMGQGGFSEEALVCAPSHLLDNKAQGVGFVSMTEAHRVLWLRS